VAAIVNSTNSTARNMNVTPLKQTIEYPNQDISEPIKQTNLDGSTINDVYSYASGVVNALTKASVDVTTIKPESIVILGIKGDMIVELMPITVKKEREQGLVAGIVEENNPQLGYLTLYNDDGTGKTPLELSTLRTFNYADPNEVEVYKNHIPAELDEIDAGDTVFVRIDDTGTVSSVSSVPNFSVRYGKVVSKKISSITVETEKGVQLEYKTDGADVIKGGKLSKISQLKAGDRVKLLLNEAPNVTVLKEITIEGGDKLVANIYKGKFQSYNDISDKILLSDPWVLRKGLWTKDTLGSKEIKVGDNFISYFGGKKLAKKYLSNQKMNELTVYIVSEKDYGNGENGVVATFISDSDKEVLYNDKVFNTSNANSFQLEKALDRISYDQGTIVVKDGRLVQGSNVTADDYAYVMANRDADTGKIVAGVVSIEDRPGMQAVQLYRGRITNIDEFKNVTIGSYSKLNGVNWDYANTPMTFSLSSNTRITDTAGIIGQGDFNSYSGVNTFKDRTIYILSDGTNAVEISTAPYGNVNISGDVISTSGGTIDEDGTQLTQPNTVKIRNCKYYNATTHLWVSMNDSSLNLLVNSLILKNNQKINPSDLKKGDKIRVLKKDTALIGDAYIVIVEE
jgi:ribosomal protein L21E